MTHGPTRSQRISSAWRYASISDAVGGLGLRPIARDSLKLPEGGVESVLMARKITGAIVVELTLM